jgi:hypothetical protein
MAGRRGSSEDMLLQQIPLPAKPTDEQIHHARLVVCSNVDDAAEAETLLAMLGLL